MTSATISSFMPIGTIGHKFGKSYENNRMPNKVIATPGSSQPCTATNLNGYAQGSSTADGLTPSCTGPFASLSPPMVTRASPARRARASTPPPARDQHAGAAGSYTSPGELIRLPKASARWKC